MKKLVTLFATLIIMLTLQAESPEKISYQAIIRNAKGELVKNQTIAMRISIYYYAKTTPVTVYSERKTPTTNENGLVSIEIGTGKAISGYFTDIDWAARAFYLKNEIDLEGGSNYTIISDTQMLSVPYAFHANTANILTPLKIGDSYQGGIIFWLDDTGQHGLIASTADQSTGIQWYNGTIRKTSTKGDGLYAGAMNTSMIVATQIADNQEGNFAAKVCADYSVTVDGVTYGDWYLPSKYELNLLYSQRTVVGGFASAYYWSSTESDNVNAWMQALVNVGQQSYFGKSGLCCVRAVRAF